MCVVELFLGHSFFGKFVSFVDPHCTGRPLYFNWSLSKLRHKPREAQKENSSQTFDKLLQFHKVIDIENEFYLIDGTHMNSYKSD